MSRTLGQTIVDREHRRGRRHHRLDAGDARAAPDGYTIIMGHMGTHAASVALYPNLAYKPDVDFAPIGLVAGTPVLILAQEGLSAQGPQGVRHLREGQRRQAEHGACRRRLGVVHDLPAAQLDPGREADLGPLQGTGPALTALIAGQVDYMCDQIVNVVQQIQAGQIKAYAIGTAERNPALPDVPTSKEAGLPEFQAQAWNALFAPKGTPQPILDKLTRRARQGARRRGDAQATARARQRAAGQGGPRPAGARRAGEERDRALDADHQGGRPAELTRAAGASERFRQAFRRRVTCRRNALAVDAPALERR